MIDNLKSRNETLIEDAKFNADNLKRQLLIKKILSEKNCFLKMSMGTSYAILRDLKVAETDLFSTYSELIDAKNIK